MEARGRWEDVFAADWGGCEKGVGLGRVVGNADVDCCCRSVGIVVDVDADRPVPSAEGGLRVPSADGGRKPLVLLPKLSGDGCPKPPDTVRGVLIGAGPFLYGDGVMVDVGLKLCPRGVPLRFVDEFHRGLSGLLSVRESAREKLLDGVGVEYSLDDTPTPGRRSATLDLDNGVLRGIALVLLFIEAGRLDNRLPAFDRAVVLLAKLPALDLAYGVETP